ncbi:penicillin-binding protein 1C [Rhodobium gokarnense]|uniref:penicillin-binding protein 1C n=1 Tax=Rhodobium gokarnense TaxID=364296 RepID=UPI002225577F|nr:penicillin-binding protein 1C [Rhodobium gokarnense]
MRVSARRLSVAAGVLAVVVGALAVAGYLAFDRWVETAVLPRMTIATSPLVVDRNDRLLRPFTVADGRWRMAITPDEVDRRYLQMLIAFEDKRFFDHPGVDPRAVLRAAWQFVSAGGEIVSGASTLTMQVARLLSERDTRSVPGKLQQMRLALALERNLSKERILELYLLHAPFGGNLEGVRAATLAYFGKEPERLTVGEAALLVALPQSPERRRPDRGNEEAHAARDRVLDRMVREGVIDRDEAEAGKREPVPDGRKPFPMLAGHLAQHIVAAHPERDVHHTTLDRSLQARLEQLAHDRARRLGTGVSVAILVADHRNGEILASVGSSGLLDEAREGHVDMTRAVRSPGSTLKPLIYGLAFEGGIGHPESLIDDRPTDFAGYAPTNFDGGYRGTVTMREALQLSLNVPAVALLDAVGPAKLVARLGRAGAHPQLPDLAAPNLAVGLGGVGITLFDLTEVYAAIAETGTAVTLFASRDDPPAKPRQERVLEARAAWQVADVLSGTPPPPNAPAGDIAFKTGTSYGYRDAWAVGFDGAHVVGVWTGRPDAAPVLGLTGISSAAPILVDAFARLGEKVPLPRAPAGTLVASTAQLPPPLRRWRHPETGISERARGPSIAFPHNGTTVDLGLDAGRSVPLALKVRDGAPPFIWFANGRPIERTPFAREARWLPDGPGFVTIAVVDRNGEADRVTVYIE